MARPEPRVRRDLLRIELLEDRINPNSGVGFFTPDTATWSLRSTASPGEADVGTFQFGLGARSTVAVVGDWNGDGTDDIGTFNTETATWSLRYGASEGLPDAGVFQFGTKGSIPVVGDWNGDGRDDIGTFNPQKATWSLRFGASGGPANAGVFVFGAKDSIPVVGDWDGDGKDGIGTYIKGSTTWTLRNTASAGIADAGTFKFGVKGGVPVTGDWNGDGVDGIGTYLASTATWTLRQIAAAGTANVGTFQAGTPGALPIVGDFTNPVDENTILTLTVKPLDIDLLGLKVQSSPITVTVSAEAGDGKLLGNLLTTVDQVLNLDQINAAVNSVLGATVDLLNSAGLAVTGVGSGVFDEAEATTTQVLELFVAPVNLDLMGAKVTTSPIRLSISATSGQGLILGNVLTALSDLFNNPTDQLDLAFINDRLAGLLADLRAQLPNFSSAEVPNPVLEEGDVLALTVPAIDLDLLGLMLKTTPISVDVSSREGDGLLLGNVLSSALSTLNATPAELSELSGHLNNVLNYVVGVLNNASLTLAPGATDALSNVLRQLTLPDLVTATPGQTAKILDLVIAQPDGSAPVNVDLLGLNVQVGSIDAELSARTGDGLVLGNLLYNVANLVNPGGLSSLIDLLTALGGGTTSNLGDVTVGLAPTASGATPVLTLTLPPLDIDLLGVEVKTLEPITVKVSAVEGDGLLLGNVLTAVSSLLNTQGIGAALNNVLDSVVGLLNGLDLSVATGSGQFDTAPASTTPIADVFVAPIRLDLLGALVETSPIHLTITAYAGDGLVLGNVLTALSDLFNNPPDQLDLAFINDRLDQLLAALNAQITTPPAETTTPVLGEGDILALTVPAIDLDLLGLVLQTDPITVNASSTEGDGLLLGNVLTSVLSTLNATPEELTRLNTTINAILAKVVGALNNLTAILPPELLATLTGALGTLSQFDLIAPAPGSTATILDLSLTSPDGTPVTVDLLGLHVTTGDINATLSAYTGEGLILGNLLYNLANLLNPGSSLLSLLLLLGR
jgi:hypothetical protein